MKKELSLTLIIDNSSESGLITSPASFDVDSITHYSQSDYYSGDNTLIIMNNGNSVHCVESYEIVKRMMENLRNQNTKSCYVVKGSGGTRYIPIDSVSHFFVSKTNKLVTLTLNSGVKIPTSMKLPALKETIKHIDMG